MQRLERLKASSLMDAKLKAARLDGYQVDGDNQKIYNLAGNYVKRFDEMYEKRQGLLFWGTVGTGKSYTAACKCKVEENKRKEEEEKKRQETPMVVVLGDGRNREELHGRLHCE